MPVISYLEHTGNGTTMITSLDEYMTAVPTKNKVQGKISIRFSYQRFGALKGGCFDYVFFLPP